MEGKKLIIVPWLFSMTKREAAPRSILGWNFASEFTIHSYDPIITIQKKK